MYIASFVGWSHISWEDRFRLIHFSGHSTESNVRQFSLLKLKLMSKSVLYLNYHFWMVSAWSPNIEKAEKEQDLTDHVGYVRNVMSRLLKKIEIFH